MKPHSKAFRLSLTSARRVGQNIQSHRDRFDLTSQRFIDLTIQRPVTFTLQELASMSGGELVGDPKLEITGAASLAEATSGEISFFASRKYIGRAHVRTPGTLI